MKRTLLFCFLTISVLLTAQTDDNLEKIRTDVDNNKHNIQRLQADVDKVMTENMYLKNILDLQKPIKEMEADHTHYKVTAVRGDKQEETLHIELLVESMDRDKHFTSVASNLVDIMGNHYMINFFLSKNHNSVQYKEVPLKMVIGFKDVKEQPKFIKILELKSRVRPEGGKYSDEYNTQIQLRDLPVVWD